MTLLIDLNADVGEGCTDDASLLALVSSANISCGAHAGDEAAIRRALRTALKHGVRIGAHPSWPDRSHAGRRIMQMSAAQLQATIHDQLDFLVALAQEEGATITHVKPHGALYNQAAGDPALAAALTDSIHAYDKRLCIVSLAGSCLLSAARKAGMESAAEAFADRAYAADGTLVARDHEQALLPFSQAIAQSLQIVRERQVRAVDGSLIPIQADTLCLHGDSPGALTLARDLREALLQAGVVIAAQIPRN